jgi:tetratricopeptide (TPR) repeat protein
MMRNFLLLLFIATGLTATAQSITDTNYSRGLQLLQQNQLPQATTYFEAYLKKNKTDVATTCLLAKIYISLNQKAFAAKNIQVATKINKNYAGTVAVSGIFYKNLTDKYDSALYFFKKLRALKADTAIDAPYNLAWAFNATKQYDSAIATLKPAIAKNPSFKTNYQEVTFSYVQLKQINQAIAYLESCIPNADVDVVYYNLTMLCLQVDGLKETFKKHYPRLRELSPKRADIVAKRYQTKFNEPINF